MKLGDTLRISDSSLRTPVGDSYGVPESPTKVTGSSLGGVLGVVLAIWAAAAEAHAPLLTRTLRLQARAERLEAFIELHLPAAAAQVALAAADPALALLPEATRGLRVEADGAPAGLQLVQKSLRRLPDGGLDASFVLHGKPAARTLRVSVEEGAPLPVRLVAPSGVKLKLSGGAGSPARGGWELRPRPGAACVIEMAK